MRVSNNQIIASGAQTMQQQAADVLKYQKQIASGNRFSKASEGAVELARGIAIQFEKTRSEMLRDNQNVVALRMGTAYTTLDTMASLLFNLKDMASRAAFPGMDESSLNALHAEARATFEAFKGLVNTTDSQGRLIFFDESIDELEIEPGVFVKEAIGYSEAFGIGAAPNPKLVSDVELFVNAIDSMTTPGTPAGLTGLNQAIDRVLSVRSRAGALNNQVDIAQASLEAKGIELDAARARLLETDIAEASTKLVRAQTLLQAAQSIFSRLESSNLFQRLG